MKLIRYILLLLLLPVVAEAQLVTTYAGNGSFADSGDNGLAVNAAIGMPMRIATDKLGNVYIVGIGSQIRKVTPDGIITAITAAGIGYSGDGGPAIDAQFSILGGGLVCDEQNNLYVADAGNNRIRKINALDGTVQTIAGNGAEGFMGDGGPATNAWLSSPQAIAIDRAGNIYVSDDTNTRIRKIDTAGIISTIAGTGMNMNNGNGGLAVNASLFDVSALCADTNNILYLSATQFTIRKIDLNTGIISHVAGTTTYGYNGDEIAADTAKLNSVWGLAIDKAGNLYLSDALMLRYIDVDGMIHKVAGTTPGNGGFVDNVDVSLARFSHIRGIAFDTCGNLLLCDEGNHRIRKVSFNPNCWPLKINQAMPLSFSIHPNPTTSTITITSSNKIKQVTIIDITGREVLRSGEATIDVSGLVSGVYFARVRDVNGGSRVEKILKE